MSTHRHSLRGYRNTCVPLFLVCCGLLLALQLWLAPSSVAIASAAHTIVVSAASPTPTVTPAQGFTLAKASVVRLLVSYTTGPDAKPVANCTGLGVLVKSLPASPDATVPNDWVLTDGSLVNKTPACATGQSNGTLSQVQILFNIASTTSKSKVVKIDTTSTSGVSNPITCSGSPNCSTGPALIAFHGDQFPVVDLATSSLADNTSAIGLTQDGVNGKIPDANDTKLDTQQYAQTIAGFLTPQSLLPTDNLEAGTPLIDDTTGHLTDLHFANAPLPIPSSAISSLIGQANKQTATPTPTPVPQPFGGPISISGISLELWQLSILILVLLVLILLTSLFIRSRVRHTQALKAEIDDADRRAAVVAREIEAMEATQQAWAQHNLASDQSTVPVLPQGLQDKTVVRQTVSDPRCPRCGEFVARDANYCPNCSQLLSPSESGLHIRVRPSAPSAQSSLPTTPLANSHARAVPPTPASMYPMGSLPDQPTMVPLPPPVSPTDAVVNHPTVEIPPDVTWKRPGSMHDDNTFPYAVQQVPGKRLGFIVGTRSDPGLKRKYKPNEDSLLAAQGLINSAPGPQPFGLFVIADGMGGHANGQDASRLAIQTIIENLLPKLVNTGTGSMDYSQVLVDGIQGANQAVHQQNMEKRGDMGTTITSALVVGPVAYVANVGDSRTYLYRDADGLHKVTNDHSVVASLVEAGIIKPDDIYTHPKRNQIYRSLGEKAAVEVDVFTVELHEGDKLLLCSDGLWDMVRDPKIEEVVKQPAPDPSMTGDALIQSALEGGGEDNVSVIVVQITEGGNPEALPRVQLLAKPDNVQMPQF